MVYPIHYRRPSFVPSSSRDSVSGEEKQKSVNESIISGSSSLSNGIPDALSFNRIISGGTCPPCTVRDFMNYLKYIAYSAENLQFFLWYRDYCARWEQLPESDRSLSPEWTKADADNAAANGPKKTNASVSQMLTGTDFAESKGSVTADKLDPFNTPSKSPSIDDRSTSEHPSSIEGRTFASSNTVRQATAEHAFDGAGMKWLPFTMQPYRDEVTRIITVYIADGAPRQLNLSDRERKDLLHALQNTTHPSAFQAIATTVEYSLRKQAHPNFIRWTICNGNRPRVVFARGLGIFGIMAGLVADLLITLSHAGRAWRVLPIIGWLVGISTLIAAWKGMCVVLHGMHHRHLRPWELFGDSTEDVVDEKTLSQESLFSSSGNSFEDEPWVPRYKKRNVIRKIFDREVWIQEPALRQIQDTIFLQSILGALLLSFIFVGIFCAVPHGNFY